jgi:hypothetical protein
MTASKRIHATRTKIDIKRFCIRKDGGQDLPIPFPRLANMLCARAMIEQALLTSARMDRADPPAARAWRAAKLPRHRAV